MPLHTPPESSDNPHDQLFAIVELEHVAESIDLLPAYRNWLIRQAFDAGVKVTIIALAARMNRRSVYKVLHRPPAGPNPLGGDQ